MRPLKCIFDTRECDELSRVVDGIGAICAYHLKTISKRYIDFHSISIEDFYVSRTETKLEK